MKKKVSTFGEKLRLLREEAGFTLKTVAEKANIDISLLAKIERNERPASKNLIHVLADFFEINEKELQDDSLSDLIAYKILDEEADLSVLRVAEEKVKYLKKAQNGK